MSIIEDLRDQYIGLMNLTYDAKVNDRVYDFKKAGKGIVREGTIVAIHPEKWYDLKIQWDDGAIDKEIIRYGGDSDVSCNICLISTKDAMEKLWAEILSIYSVDNRIDLVGFCRDLSREELNADQMKAKYKISDAEWDYLIHSPYVKFFFS